jgi:hypothetical protein
VREEQVVVGWDSEEPSETMGWKKVLLAAGEG